MAKVNTLAAQLKAKGVEILKITHADDGCDAEIDVTTTISVQVGRSYMIVNRTEGEGDDWCMHHGAARKNVDAIIADIAAAKAAEKV